MSKWLFIVGAVLAGFACDPVKDRASAQSLAIARVVHNCHTAKVLSVAVKTVVTIRGCGKLWVYQCESYGGNCKEVKK